VNPHATGRVGSDVGSRVRHLLLMGAAGLVVTAVLAALFVVLFGMEDDWGPAVFLAVWIVLFLAAPLDGILRRTSPRRHPGRRVDPDAVAAVHAAHAPSRSERTLALLRVLGVAAGIAVLFWLGGWALIETFESPWFLLLFLGSYTLLVLVVACVLRERRTKMRSLGPRTSDRVRRFQRKEITNPQVTSKWEV